MSTRDAFTTDWRATNNDGHIEGQWIRTLSDDGREMTLQIDHLAPPHKFDGGYRAYAVWIAVPGHGIAKIGTLDYSAKKRQGQLVATSPHAKANAIP